MDKELNHEKNMTILCAAIASLAKNVAKLTAWNTDLGLHNQQPIIDDMAKIGEMVKAVKV